MMDKLVSNLGSAMATGAFFYCTASMVFVYALFREHFPQHLQDDIEKYGRKLVSFAYPYTQITFDEFTGEYMKRSEAFAAIQNYLSGESSMSAKRLKADAVQDSKSLVLSIDYNEEISDVFEGVKVWWTSNTNSPRSFQITVYPSMEKRYYKLTVHNSQKELIKPYLDHVLNKGKEIGRNKCRRKLYCNNPSKHWNGYNRNKWSHVVFEHPARFDTLAMDSKKKQRIVNDLKEFRDNGDYYAEIGKAWKRGYLLHGPPGTGKSTMIAAMANFMEYDVYDLELSTVKDNTELRRLFIDTSEKSIIVIEDIDCSLELAGRRENKTKEMKSKNKEKNIKEMDPFTKQMQEEETTDSKVTLSGLLNFIDGLWSACGGERIIVFTTNHVEKLDPALIRRGRMDMEIEMSYCGFEAFMVLAKNYLKIDSHSLFDEIESFLGTTNMTPADVTENLMPKFNGESVEMCLNRLIEALKAAKEGESGKKVINEKRKRNSNPVKKRKKRTVR